MSEGSDKRLCGIKQVKGCRMIDVCPPERGKAAVQRSVSKRRCEFKTSPGLSYPMKRGKD